MPDYKISKKEKKTYYIPDWVSWVRAVKYLEQQQASPPCITFGVCTVALKSSDKATGREGGRDADWSQTFVTWPIVLTS